MPRAFVGASWPTRTTGILASALSRDADGDPCAMRWLLFFLVSILPATTIHRQELLSGDPRADIQRRRLRPSARLCGRLHVFRAGSSRSVAGIGRRRGLPHRLLV